MFGVSEFGAALLWWSLVEHHVLDPSIFWSGKYGVLHLGIVMPFDTFWTILDTASRYGHLLMACHSFAFCSVHVSVHNVSKQNPVHAPSWVIWYFVSG